MREHAGVFASVFVVVALVAGLCVGILGMLAHAATIGIRGDLAGRAGEERALRLTVDATVDPQAADRAVRPIIAEEFRAGGRQIPIEVDHAVWTASATPFTALDAVPDPDHPAPPMRVAAATIPGIENGAQLVDGAWPSGDDEAALQADAAAALGLATGDRVVLADTVLLISGTWRVTDPLAARWVGDEMMSHGEQAGEYGPLLVPERIWSSLPDNRRDTWTIIPDATRLDAGDLDGITLAWERLKPAVQLAGIGDVTQQDGLFTVTASQLVVPVRALAAAAPAALLIVGAIALVTLVELGRLLAELRARELALLWARGATPTGIGVVTAAETAVVALLAAAAGGFGAVLLVGADDPDVVRQLGSSVWSLPALTAAAAIAAVATQSLLATRRAARIDDPSRSGRPQRVAGAGLVVLVAIGAGVALAQLRLYNSPVTTDANGVTGVDAVAVSAPALLIVAIVLLGLVVFPRIAPLAERVVARRGGARAVLAARSIGRRIALGATPIALVALAASQLIIAAGYSGTWQQAFEQNQALRMGTELRVEVAEPGLDDASLDALVGVDALERVVPVARDEIKLGDDYLSLVGVDAPSLAALGLRGGGTVDVDALARTIRTEAMAPQLPAGATTLTLRIGLPTGTRAPAVGVWFADDDGLLRFSPAPHVEQGEAASFAAAVPAAPGAMHRWRLVAVDITPVLEPTGPDARPLTVMLLGADADGTAIDLGTGWSGIGFSPDPTPLAGVDQNGVQLDAELPFARLVAPSTGLPRLVISEPLATRMNAHPGSSLVLPLDHLLLHVEVGGVTEAIPASSRGSAALIDIHALIAAQLRSLVDPDAPTLYWIGARDTAAAAQAIRAVLPGAHVVEASRDPNRPMLGTAASALWAAAAGSLLLVLAALSALLGAQLGARRQETAVLRALGLGAREQAAVRRGELIVLSCYGAIIGAIAGFVVIALAITAFARAAVPAAYSGVPTRVVVDAPVLGIVLLVAALAVAALLAGYGVLIARQARRAIVLEEAR